MDMVIVYTASTKTKTAAVGADTKLYSHEHIRKINDAILFSSRTVKQVLSLTYYSEMHSFLVSFNKKTADACSHGSMDEKSADPIIFSLFCLIFTWAIERGNKVVWVWTVKQIPVCM